MDEGIIPNGILLLLEEHSGPDLPTSYTDRTWREASHLTREGYKTGSGCDALCGGRSRDGNSGSGPSSVHVRKAQTPAQRTRHSTVRSRILSGRETDRFGTWNVRTLRELGKLEQLAGEMKRYRLSILAVTETHLLGEGEMVLNAETAYKLLFSGRTDGSNVEGLGIALSPHTNAALRHYISSSVPSGTNCRVSFLSRSTVNNRGISPH